MREHETGRSGTQRAGDGHRGSGADAGYEPRPRWVIALVAVAAVLAVLMLVLLLSGGGHGPGRHAAGQATTAGAQR